MFKSILLPLDLANTTGPEKALVAAVDLARHHSADLHVVTVVPDFGMAIVGTFFEEGFEEKALTAARQQLSAFVDAHVPDDIQVRAHVAHGTIYDQILRATERLDVDLIVIASHRPELRDYLLGPNAARIVRHANQSVFVVRE